MSREEKARVVKRFNEVIDLDDILPDLLNIVGEELVPEDVFSDSKLSTWAGENGYVET